MFMPHVSEWWEAVSDTVKSTFLTLLQDVPSFSPVLIVATAESHYSQLPDEVGVQLTQILVDCYTSIFKHSNMGRTIILRKMFLLLAFKKECLKKLLYSFML